MAKWRRIRSRFPLKPPPFARQMFTPGHRDQPHAGGARGRSGATAKSFAAAASSCRPACRARWSSRASMAGGEWGGPAFDPETGVLYVNSNEMAWILRLVARPGTCELQGQPASLCRELRQLPPARTCAGSPPEFPSLVGHRERSTRKRKSPRSFGRAAAVCRASPTSGKNVIAAMAHFLATGEDIEFATPLTEQLPKPLKYTHDGYNKFLDAEGYPAVAPPWGTLNAIDLNTGAYVWKKPFGEFPELVAKGMRQHGQRELRRAAGDRGRAAVYRRHQSAIRN